MKKFEGDMTADNSTVVLQELLTSARPLVGLRRKSNEDWYSYPKLVAYLEVDTTKEGVQGQHFLCCSICCIGKLYRWIETSSYRRIFVARTLFLFV